jgi:hypothetical protein
MRTNRSAAALLPLFLPLAAKWVRVREREALELGVPLDSQQLSDARLVGVHAPERVRLLNVPSVPVFKHPLLRPIACVLRNAFAGTAGITLRYGILIREDCWGDRRLVVHELAHVAQYERLGGITPFLRIYLRECLMTGYPNGALEREAIEAAARHRY